MLVSDTTPVSETFLFFQIRGWSKGCHFLHLLREVQARCFISWQLYLLTRFSQYCTLKTAYDSKTSPCPSHYEQVKEAWSSLVAMTTRENNGTLVRLIQTDFFKKFPKIFTLFAGSTLRDKIRRHIDTIVSLKTHRHIKPMDTLENGSRQRIDRILIRGENVLKVLIVKALKINSRHRVFIAATINCIDNAAIAIIWLALKRSRIYIFSFIGLSNRPHIQPLSY